MTVNYKLKAAKLVGERTVAWLVCMGMAGHDRVMGLEVLWGTPGLRCFASKET